MMWAPVLMLLCLALVVVVWWKPSKSSRNPAPIQAAMDRMISRPSDPLSEEIEIIAEALREREAARRKADALARLKQLLSEE